MKLSKKLIAALIIAAMVIAQVSVLPFAETGANNPYLTGKDDGAYYFWRVPNTQADGSELLKNSAGRTYFKAADAGISNFNVRVGRHYNTLSYTDAAKTSAMFVEEFDGERFVEIVPNSASTTHTEFELSSSAMYNGAPLYPEKGIPEQIDYSKITGFAIRFKVVGEGKSGFEVRVADTNCIVWGYMQNLKEYTFIDAKTGEISKIRYGDETGGRSYCINKEMDGWIVVPFTAYFSELSNYNPGQIAYAYKQNWVSLGLHIHMPGCGTNHSAGWSDWSNRKLYVGDSVFITDQEKFINAYSKPAAPEVDKKYDDSIKLKNNEEHTYSIAKKSAPETIIATSDNGEFKNLEENTEYVITTSWKDQRTPYTTQITVRTDLSNPPLTTPELDENGLNATNIKVKVIPGLEYSIKGTDVWNESGLFEDLTYNTEYTILARNKKTLELADELVVTTPFPENRFERTDGATTIFAVPSTGTTYKSSDISGSSFVKDANGTVPIVKGADGCRLIQLTPKATEKQNISFSGRATWGRSTAGVPDEINLEKFWGIGLRIKVDEGPEDLYFYLRNTWYDPAKDDNVGYEFKNGWNYYLIDSKTGTWSKEVKNGYWKLQGFDGWILLPFSSYYKDATITAQYIQERFASMGYYLNGNTSQNGTISWGPVEGTKEATNFYMGDAVFVEDIERFVEVYAPNNLEPIIPAPRNNMTDKNIPAIMANDCSGNKIGDGLISVEKVRPNVVEITKPNEKSDALHITPGYGISSIMITDDAFNYDVIPPEVNDRTSDSTGIAFYLEVPETMDKRAHFGVRVFDDGAEYHNFGTMYSYITISNGVATEKYGALEFMPGFKGYVMLPFLHFDYEAPTSENVDGMLNSPDTIGSIGFTFDADTYPEMAETHIIVDDLMLYQIQAEFIDAIVKIQGGTDSTLIIDEKTFNVDLNPNFPRIMANDCTGIEEEEGIHSIDGVWLTLVDRKGVKDSYVDITIGDKITSVMFGNYAVSEEATEEEIEKLNASTGVSFDISVPEDALMTVGTDFEISEGESEYFLYDSNKFYYTVENGQVYKVYGYLEFEPGFNGTVLVPFENFYFDAEFSEEYDGMLNYFDLIDYFGFYFSTDYYASIEDTTISIDNIAFYEKKYDYMNAILEKQTGKGTINPKAKEAGNEAQVISTESPKTGEATPIVAVAGLLAVSAAAVALTRKKKED